VISDVELLTLLGPKLRCRAAQMLGSQSRYADDLAQEGWVAVWRALPTVPVHLLSDADALEGWCIGVARNKMRNWIRDELAAPRRGLNNETSTGALFEALSHSESLEAVDLGYHEGRLSLALDALPPGQREYVLSRFWLGIPTTELHGTGSRFSNKTWVGAKKNLLRALTTV